MNILVTAREADNVTYRMLGERSMLPGFRVYIAFVSEENFTASRGKCFPLVASPTRHKVSLHAIRDLRKIIRAHKIDLVFSPSSSGLSNALLASRGLSVRNVGYRGTQASISRWDPTYHLGILNPRVAHIVCETPDIKAYLSGFIPEEKLSVALKPFDITWGEQAARERKEVPGVPSDALHILYIGVTRARPYKGLKDLILAFNLLRTPHVHLTIIGDYDAADAELVRDRDRVHFLGDQPEAMRYLPGATLFVLPSHRDASPRVVREAMACGVPCIVTNIPGARDLIVDGESGILTPPRDPQRMAQSIDTLLGDPERRERIGKAGAERIRTYFSFDTYIRYFADLFTRLSGEGKRGC